MGVGREKITPPAGLWMTGYAVRDRPADGTAQAWENRCPHRSVRFTLGHVVENRLVCAYHGWQYTAGSGQCAHIPAHPDMPPPRNVCAKVFSAVEAAGMVWVYLGAAEPPPPPRRTTRRSSTTRGPRTPRPT